MSLTLKRLLLAAALGIAAVVPAQASENLETAGWLRVYFNTCYADLTPEKRDIYLAIALKDIDRFGKEAVEQASREQYHETVYKQGAASFCKTAGWFLK